MNLDLSGTTALVTGATSGLGRATALMFASCGATVLATGRDVERGATVSRQISRAGGSCTFIRADLASGHQVEALLRDVEDRVPAVDVLVNNAGVTTMVTAAQTTEEIYREMFAVNVRAPMLLVGRLVPAMVGRGHGAVVNVTSLAADRGMPVMGLYGASKAALTALTRAWATEFGPHGVRVNAVSPALVDTEGTAHIADVHRQGAARSPGRSVGRPEDVAAAIAFLSSDAARHIHGAILPVDGGLLASA